MKRSVVVAAPAVALGAALLAAVVVSVQRTPASPTVKWLASQGLTISPLNETEPVTMGQAEASVPALWKRAPMVAELVLFSSPGTTVPESLGRPQPAWLITWDQTSSSGGAYNESSLPPVVVTYHHMNLVVSAVTGQTLESFASP